VAERKSGHEYRTYVQLLSGDLRCPILVEEGEEDLFDNTVCTCGRPLTANHLNHPQPRESSPEGPSEPKPEGEKVGGNRVSKKFVQPSTCLLWQLIDPPSEPSELSEPTDADDGRHDHRRIE